MRLTVLHNDLDDCLLFVDGSAHSDIDYRDAMCLQWLKDVISEKVLIEFKLTDLKRKDYPDVI